jgi:hypothetical protein
VPTRSLRALSTMLLAASIVATAGCAQSTPQARPASAAPTSKKPSDPAQMICAEEAQKDIATAIGVEPSQPVTPNWSGNVYSCRYVYPSGVIVLSVKELADTAAATAYFNARERESTGHTSLQDLGEAAFSTRDGSVVTRKDNLVLDVDVHAMPQSFGRPDRPRDFGAYAIASAILKCWIGVH